jgi:hypothetical protein
VLFLGLFVVISLDYIAVILRYFGYLGGHGTKLFLLFIVDHDSSLPTIFNAVLILIAFAILLMVSVHLRKIKSDQFYNWLLLTAAFLLLSLDENPTIHKIFVSAISRLIWTGQAGDVNYALGMPYGALALIFVFFLYRFITSLPPNIAFGFIVSGSVYVTGALILGFYGTHIFDVEYHHSVKYLLVASLEESFEMVGLTLFIYFLFEYIQREFRSLSIKLN